MPVIVLEDSITVVNPDKYNTPVFEPLDVLYPYAKREVEKKNWMGIDTTASISVEESVLVVKSTDKLVSTSGATKHHLLNAILHAYNNHIGLRLTPDDILQCFNTVVVQCINDNSEKYRDVFVSHQGKKKLVIVANTPPGKFNWGDLVSMMSDKIDESVKTSLGLESDFTTSTPVTKAVSDMMKMAAFKSYFSYGMMMMCGIRKVDLTGTLEDWLKLRGKIVKCGDIFTSRGDMVNWSNHFLKVLDMIIETYKASDVGSGVVGMNPLPRHLVKFWSRIVTYVPYGSGGQKYVSGWAKVLVPGTNYNKFPEKLNLLDNDATPPSREKVDRYKYQNICKEWYQLCEDAPVGVSRVEAELNDYGMVYDFCCTVGHLGWQLDGDFACGEMGYVVHAIAKDASTVTDEVEAKIVSSEDPGMVLGAIEANVKLRKDNLDVYREEQKRHLEAIKKYQKGKSLCDDE